MAKSQQPSPLAQRVAEDLELVQRVAKGRATWVQTFHNKFWSAVEEADPLIQSFVREQMDAFLLAVASGHHMQYNSKTQHKPAGSLPKPSQCIPARPPIPTAKQPQSWASTAAGPPATVPPASSSSRSNTTSRPPCTPVPKKAAITKGSKAIFRLSEEAPLLRADATTVKSAFIQIVGSQVNGV